MGTPRFKRRASRPGRDRRERLSAGAALVVTLLIIVGSVLGYVLFADTTGSAGDGGLVGAPDDAADHARETIRNAVEAIGAATSDD